MYLDASRNTIMHPLCSPAPFKPLYDLGFSFFSFHSADNPTPETLTTLNRTPGISPFALPFRPNPASSTSSFSSTKFKQPSFGTVKPSVSHQTYPSHPHLSCQTPSTEPFRHRPSLETLSSKSTLRLPY